MASSSLGAIVHAFLDRTRGKSPVDVVKVARAFFLAGARPPAGGDADDWIDSVAALCLDYEREWWRKGGVNAAAKGVQGAEMSDRGAGHAARSRSASVEAPSRRTDEPKRDVVESDEFDEPPARSTQGVCVRSRSASSEAPRKAAKRDVEDSEDSDEPVLRRPSRARPVVVDEDDEDSSESDEPVVRRPSRARARPVVVDEDEEEEVAPVAKPQEEEIDLFIDVDSSDEEEAAPAATPAAAPVATPPVQEESDLFMDVDSSDEEVTPVVAPAAAPSQEDSVFVDEDSADSDFEAPAVDKSFREEQLDAESEDDDAREPTSVAPGLKRRRSSTSERSTTKKQCIAPYLTPQQTSTPLSHTPNAAKFKPFSFLPMHKLLFLNNLPNEAWNHDDETILTKSLHASQHKLLTFHARPVGLSIAYRVATSFTAINAMGHSNIHGSSTWLKCDDDATLHYSSSDDVFVETCVAHCALPLFKVVTLER